MKRLISFAAAAAMLFAAAPKTPSYAAETPAGASCVVYKVEKDHISIDGIGKDFRNGDLVIPENIKIINENAFEDCSSLRKLTLNDGVEIIKDNAFLRCSNLNDVTFCKTLRRIGTCAFLHTEWWNKLKPNNGAMLIVGNGILVKFFEELVPNYKNGYCDLKCPFKTQ